MTSTLTTTATSAPEPPEEDIEALLDLDDEGFALVVSDALFYAVGPVEAEPDWQCLFHCEVIDRTAAELLVARTAVERRLSDARRDGGKPPTALVQQFRAIGTRQTQAKKIRPARDRHVEKIDREAKEARNAVRLLTHAIQRHRLAAVSAGLEPEPGDRELWATLDEVQLPFGSRTASLTEILGSGAWTDGDS